MACPTCDHTMECHCNDAAITTWHCPRCGTMKIEYGHCSVDVFVPKLVERCRKFIGVIGATVPNPHLAAVHNEWWTVGIAEATQKPEDRR